ncbi:MAG TPA: hypothetical protein VKQ32_01245, partial [Polyangia bacterium]|nr:hypothetical protein [Polyangia bacterium]
MNRLAVAACAVLALCAVPFLVAHPLQAAPPPTNTEVINDSAHPVPVALGGPVAISGPLSLSGPMAVAGTVFTAPANNPTPVSSIGILGALSGRSDRQVIYTVPPGKRLIIQSETALTNCNGGVKPEASVSAFNNSGGGLFYTVV